MYKQYAQSFVFLRTKRSYVRLKLLASLAVWRRAPGGGKWPAEGWIAQSLARDQSDDDVDDVDDGDEDVGDDDDDVSGADG